MVCRRPTAAPSPRLRLTLGPTCSRRLRVRENRWVSEPEAAGPLSARTAWANVHDSSYERVWQTQLSIRLGSTDISQSLRGWVSTGLMTLFWFVIGLEARREFDMGELRQRTRVALPVLAGIGGMIVPVAIYLVANAGSGSADGWGAAMSTDTAFDLGSA